MAFSKKNNKTKKQSPRTNPKKLKGLEYTVAALLLTGKLKVDSVEIFREASFVVTLVGQYTSNDINQNNVEQMVQFLDNHGDLTFNDFINALKKKAGN
jgi:hypothetical protein